MSDRTLVASLRGAVLVGSLLGVAGSVALLAGGHADLWWSNFGTQAVFPLLLLFLLWRMIARQPRNAAVWTLAASAFAGLYTAGLALAASLVEDDSSVALGAGFVPAELPTEAAWVMVATVSASALGFFPLLTFGLLLFPDGRLPSPRWRGIAWLAAVGIGLAVIANAWNYRPESLSTDSMLETVGDLAIGVAAASSLAALIVRFRHSTGATRQQFKWIAWGASLLVPVIVVDQSTVIDGTPYETYTPLAILATGLVMVVAYAVAVGKYRLYDIDVVVSRTVVYGSLAVFITGAYVGVVVGLGGLLGAERSSPLPAVGATALVAFAFEPLRRRLQRLANRLVYGTRATPYEVLSDFSRRITATDSALLDQVTHSLADGTTATEAAVWVTTDGALTRAAVWPPLDDPAAVEASDVTEIPDADVATPVTHDGELLGALTLTAPRGQDLRPPDLQLVDQVASGLGLALRNLQLSEDLQRQVAELGRSRQRIVAVQDETRRRLERELHDGIQQRLVAIKVRLGLARPQAEVAHLSEVTELLDGVAADTDRAIDSLREFARGIYPPLLEADGLGPALASQVQRLPIPVTVHAAGVNRQPAPVEAAVYFCVLEALQNVVKHAEASSAHVALHQTDHDLTFEVTDDGKGFDPQTATTGSGLANLTDRLDALDGSLQMISAPGQGTTLRGLIPTRATEKVF